jgi:hypothetical protein
MKLTVFHIDLVHACFSVIVTDQSERINEYGLHFKLVLSRQFCNFVRFKKNECYWYLLTFVGHVDH